MRLVSTAAALALSIVSMPAHAKTSLQTVCQMIVDGEGRRLVQSGNCDQRYSPASTFKVALSVMGFDNGILKDATAPRWPVKKHYDILLPQWGQATDPSHWMRHSVVWFSQELAEKLGRANMKKYLQMMSYGNQDMSGLKGPPAPKNFWVGSTLKISTEEQVAFLRKLMHGDLPVSQSALAMTKELMDLGVQPNGWHLYGKTGAARQRDANGRALNNSRHGWFVGFAQKGERKVVFAKLIQSTQQEAKSLGLLAKDQMIGDYFSAKSPL